MTTAVSTPSKLPDIQKAISGLRIRAEKHISDLDAQMRAINDQLRTIELRVPRQVFVRKILDDASRFARNKDVGFVTSAAKGKSFLMEYVPLEKASHTDANGVQCWTTTDPFQRGRDPVFADDIPACALIGLFPEVFEPSIIAWANRLADELDLPDTGTIEELQAEHERLTTKLKALAEARAAAREQFSQLVNVSISPFIIDDGNTDAPEPTPAPPQRSAGVYNADGTPATSMAIGSDGWREYWAYRRAEEAREKAATAAERST